MRPYLHPLADFRLWADRRRRMDSRPVRDRRDQAADRARQELLRMSGLDLAAMIQRGET